MVSGDVLVKTLGKLSVYPANIYLLKVHNRNARKRFETCSKLTIKTLFL